MSDTIDAAVAMLTERLAGADIANRIKFAIEGEGDIMVTPDGIAKGDEEADVTLKADAETFQEILSGALNPTAAFMSGRLAVDGDMGAAMALGSALS
ncbi:MAG: SCP2 sterol-binding domain-containing protein [Pseudomonadota bacterium]